MTERSTDLENLAWLVDSRNKIQSLMLRLYRLAQDPDVNEAKRPENLHDLIGAAFSLWRAVFLANAKALNSEQDPEGKKRGPRQKLDKDAADFLKRVIDTNAISFVDDLRFGSWTVGYYLNNARFRLGLPMVNRDDLPQDYWDKTFSKLEETLQSVEKLKTE